MYNTVDKSWTIVKVCHECGKVNGDATCCSKKSISCYKESLVLNQDGTAGIAQGISYNYREGL